MFAAFVSSFPKSTVIRVGGPYPARLFLTLHMAIYSRGRVELLELFGLAELSKSNAFTPERLVAAA